MIQNALEASPVSWIQTLKLYDGCWSAGTFCLNSARCRATCLAAVIASAKAFFRASLCKINCCLTPTEQLALAGEGEKRAPQEPRAKELPYVIDCPASYEVRAYPGLEVDNL